MQPPPWGVSRAMQMRRTRVWPPFVSHFAQNDPEPPATPAHPQGACRPPAPHAVVRRSGDGQWRQRLPRCCWCCPRLPWGGMGDTPCTLARAVGLRRHRAAPTHPRPHADRQPRALSCTAMALEMAPIWPYCPSDATQGRRGVRVGHWGGLQVTCRLYHLGSPQERHIAPYAS